MAYDLNKYKAAHQSLLVNLKVAQKQHDEIMERFKSEYDCSSVEEVEKLLAEIETDIEEIDKKIVKKEAMLNDHIKFYKDRGLLK